MNPRDTERRRQVAEILGEPKDLCPVDPDRAAVFQHGRRPNDFLFAHVLASAAAVRGREPVRWMSAAALDRYHTRVGQAQIFATQSNGMPGEPRTQWSAVEMVAARQGLVQQALGEIWTLGGR